MEFTKLMENYILQIIDDIFPKIKANIKDFSNNKKANEILEKYILFIDDISKEKYKEFFVLGSEKSSSKKERFSQKGSTLYIKKNFFINKKARKII